MPRLSERARQGKNAETRSSVCRSISYLADLTLMIQNLTRQSFGVYLLNPSASLKNREFMTLSACTDT